jgi:glycosyltransferase involved in cell wall biosynthesis
VNFDEFKKENREIDDEVKKIISVGRLTPAKDYKNLFNAIKILEKKLKKDNAKMPEFLIVGDGELEKDLKDLSKNLNIDDYVIFLGLRNDIPDLLNDSDIYVMSSEWEGLSIALIEAAVSGIPVIATDAGSNSEIIKDGVNGIIVPATNSEFLADGLFKLIKNKNLRVKYSKKRNILEKFSLQNSIENHLEMYKNFLF